MDIGAWCAHDHTVIMRLTEKEGFTVESVHHTSDYLVTEVRIRRRVNEPDKRNVSLQGLLLGKNGKPTQRSVTRTNFDYNLLPDWLQVLADSHFTTMHCGVE